MTAWYRNPIVEGVAVGTVLAAGGFIFSPLTREDVLGGFSWLVSPSAVWLPRWMWPLAVGVFLMGGATLLAPCVRRFWVARPRPLSWEGFRETRFRTPEHPYADAEDADIVWRWAWDDNHETPKLKRSSMVPYCGGCDTRLQGHANAGPMWSFLCNACKKRRWMVPAGHEGAMDRIADRIERDARKEFLSGGGDDE